jgi:lipoprotein-anchoring transpeptidase ErfK/SrfK
MPGRVDRRPSGRRAGRAIGVGSLLLSLLAATACSSEADAAGPKASFHKLPGAAKGAGAPAMTLTPAAGAAGVSVSDPVSVAVSGATISDVTLTGADGKPVPGELAPDKHTWRSATALGYNKKYTLKAVANGADGKPLEQSSTFTTVKPSNLTLPYLRANPGLLLADRPTYGVGQIIIVGFDEKIPDRAAAEKSLEVVTEPKVAGAWHWTSDKEVQWRPPEYWVTGTKVTVRANVYGKNLGNGLYGERDVAASFTIGQSKIAVADDKSHHINVFIDGQLVRSVPTAMGKNEQTRGANGQWIDFRTRSGVHVVMGTERVTRMTSASFGITTGDDAYDEKVEWTTHISVAGEYIHAAPWSVGDQGRRNASHGCLNVNTENAKWFYNSFGPGDIVNVLNTGIQLESWEALNGWNVPWDKWVAGSAVPQAPAPQASASASSSPDQAR